MRIAIIAAVVFFVLCGVGFCHPPQDITISVSEQTVTISVAHKVENPTNHFIDDIMVSVNGKKAIQQHFTLQFDNAIQEAVYFIPSLKSGDVVKVTADCNKYGDLTKETKVQ